MILKKYSEDKLYLEIKGFNIDTHMKHLFSTRIGWKQESLLDDLSQVLDVDRDKIYSVTQVHGTDIEIIEDQNRKSICNNQKDGLITNKKGIVLSTYHADCVPIYFYDKKIKVIGLAHSGWKGTLNNISKEMISKFKEKFNSNLDDIMVAIGPSIGPCCYEIGQDVEKLFYDKYSNKDNIIIKNRQKTYLDLWKVNKINLLDIGIKLENIIENSLCTSCNLDFLYSYRKENTKNRMIGAITLNS